MIPASYPNYRDESKAHGAAASSPVSEALTAAVFGFAITFLFVSFDVPTEFDALVVQLKGFVPFAACLALLIPV